MNPRALQFKPPFVKIDCQITNRCDARCEFCPCWRDEGPRVELPPERWIGLARRLQELTKIDFFCIGGGEPMLYRGIYTVLRGLAELEVPTVMVTNGRLLTQERCRELVDSGVGEVDISIDAFAELHDEMRGVPGIFDRALAGARRLKDLRPELRIVVSTLICGKNLHQLSELTHWLLDNAAVDAVNFQAYNQVIHASGPDALTSDPLWPTDPTRVREVMGQLKQAAQSGLAIANHPSQFDKFADYFADPNQDLGIRCPAGTFNFSVGHTGNVTTCILDPPVGNIEHDDPITLYAERFPAVRAKARDCCINCHFLVNCLYYINWKEWDLPDGAPAGPDATDELQPGRLVFPPELRRLVRDTRDVMPDNLPPYAEVEPLDTLGRAPDPRQRRVPDFFGGDVPCVYLAGDTSELHRWGAELDEQDWFHQRAALEELHRGGGRYHTIIGVRRTNFHLLPRIFNFIRETRGQPPLDLPTLDPRTPRDIGQRFEQHLAHLTQAGRDQGVELRVVDPELPRLLSLIERAPERPDYDEKDLLVGLGPVCKDVFTGPKYLLFDMYGRCNTDCVYCRLFSPWVSEEERQRFKREGTYGEWSFDYAEEALREAKRLDVQRVLLVGRGEPTLHPAFGRVVELVRELGMSYCVSTNGILLDRSFDSLLSGACESVTVSLSFASDETFRAIRPGTRPELRQRIEDNVMELSRRRREAGDRLPRIIALYAINALNHREVVEMAHHACKLGADAIWYQLVHLSDFMRDRLQMDDSQMEAVRRSMAEARQICDESGIGWQSFIDFELAHFDQDRGDWSKGGMLHQGCFVGWHFAFLNLSKEVFFCCGNQIVHALTPGADGLRDLWYSDVWRRYRNDALIMHRENPIDFYGRPFYNAYCDSCDNHDQQVRVLEILDRYGLRDLVER